MPQEVIEVNEDRIPKERPPKLEPIPTNIRGNIIITGEMMGGFSVFGRRRSTAPRIVTTLSRLTTPKDIIPGILNTQMTANVIQRDDPEEIYRVWNYAKLARGRTVAYGLGLGLFHRMALQARARELICVEDDPNILSLVWSSVVWSRNDNTTLEYQGPLEKFAEAAEEKCDFVYIHQPISRNLSEYDTLIRAARHLLHRDGRIAIRGYRGMIQTYQERCQEICNCIAMDQDAFGNAETYELPEERLFVKWAMRNRKRVVVRRDYKCINSWARRTAHEMRWRE